MSFGTTSLWSGTAGNPDQAFDRVTSYYSAKGLVNPSEPCSRSFAAGITILRMGVLALTVSDAELASIYSRFKACDECVHARMAFCIMQCVCGDFTAPARRIFVWVVIHLCGNSTAQ